MPEITMPQLGETVTEGTITKWLKQVGDHIDEDELIYEVSTDKVDSEVPSPVAGYLTEIRVPEGETVEVGAVLAVVADEPPAGGAAPAPAEQAATAPAPAPTATPESQAATPSQADAGASTPAPAASEPAPATAEAESGSATPAAPEPAPATAEAESGSATPAAPAGRAVEGNGGGGVAGVLSPVVRRLLAEHHLDPSQIKGTGAGGRITRADVLGVIERGGAGRAETPTATPPAGAPAEPARSVSPAAAPSAARATPSAPDAAPQAPTPAPPAARAGERDEVVAFSNIRKRTAEHMVRSQATSAHTLVVIEVDYQAVEAVRAEAKERFRAEEGVALNYLAFIARATIDAIREFPHVNATVGNDELIVHHYVNLGIAVDLNFDGLIVPVVRDADGKRMRAIAREIADLAGRARAKRLTADDIAGGTFTITNPGGYGTLLTAPIINQPQVGILSTDGVKPKPVAVALPDGTFGVAVHPVGNLALSFDHRAYDGAYASAFLARIKEILETRDWASEL